MSKQLGYFLYFGIFTALAGHNRYAFADDFYIVKRGDVLTHIARRTFGVPVYSNHGSYLKIIALNPEIKNPNFLAIGQKVRIFSPSDQIAVVVENANYRQVSSVSEVSEVSEVAEVAEVSEVSEVAEVAEVKTPAAVEVNSYQRTSGLQIAPEFKFIRIDSTYSDNSAAAELLSSSHLALPISWTQHWSRDISSFERFSFSKTTFSDPIDGSVLKNPSISQYGFGFGLRFFEAAANRLSIELAADQKMIARATGTNSYIIDSVTIPNLKLRSDHQLFDLDPFQFGVSLLGTVWAPTSQSEYDTKLGLTYGAGVYLAQNFEFSKLSVGLNYLKSQENTTISTQSKSEIGFGFQYSLNFGAGTKDKMKK